MKTITDNTFITKAKDNIRSFISQHVATVDKDWQIFFSVIEFAEYEFHEMLLEQGAVEKNLYCILEGVVRKFTLQDGREYTFAFNFPVSFFNSYLSFTNQQASEMAIQAVTKIKVGIISADKMPYLYKQAPHAPEIGLKMLELAHQVTVKKEISQNTHTAEHNYKNLLEHNPELVLQIPSVYIASYLGVTPVSLSRIRNKIFSS